MTGRRRALAVLGLGMVGVLAVVALAKTPWARQTLLDRLGASLRDRYGLVLRVERLDLRLTALAITLNGLTLTPETAPGYPLLRAERVDVDLSARAVLGRWSFDRIALVRPVVCLDVTRTKPSRIASRAGVPTGLEVGVFEVQDLTLDGSGARGVRIAVRGMEARGSGSEVDIEIAGSVAIDAPPAHLRYDRLAARLSLRDGSLAIASVRAESDRMALQLGGTVGISEPGRIDLRYETTLALDGRDRVIDGMPPIRGRVSMRGTIVGTRSHPSATYHLRAESLEWAALRDGVLEATGRLSKDRLVVDARLQSASLGSMRGRGVLALDTTGTSRVSSEWNAPSLGSWSFLLRTPPGTPRLSATGTTECAWPGLRPTSESLSVTGRAVLRRPGNETPASATIGIDGQRGRFALRFDASLAGSTVVTGDVSTHLAWPAMSSSRVTGNISLQSVETSAAARQLRAIGLAVPEPAEAAADGTVVLSGSLGGTLAAPSLRATLNGTATIAPFDRVVAHAVLSADPDEVSFDPLTLQSADGRIELRGSIALGDLSTTGSLDARLDRVDALGATLPPTWRPAGSAWASGSWSGTWEQPIATVHLGGSALGVGGLRFDRFSGEVALAGRTLRVSDLTLTQPEGLLRAGGQMNLESRVFSLNVEARHLDLWSGPAQSVRPRADMSSAAMLTGVGDVSLRARVRGSFAAGELSRPIVDVDVLGLDGGVLGRRVTLENAVTLTYSDEGLSLPAPARLTYGRATLTASGHWSEYASEGLALTLDGIVEDLLPLLQVNREERPWAGEGSLGLRVVLAGPYHQPRLAGEALLAVRSLRHQEREVAQGLTVKARLHEDAVELVDMSGRVLGGAVQATGSIPLGWLLTRSPIHQRTNGQSAQPPATLAAAWQIDLAEALRSLGRETSALGGTATLSLQASATEPRLEAIEGSLTGVVEQLTGQKVPILERAPIAARLKDGRLRVDALHWQGPEMGISISGDLGVVRGVEGNLRLEGQSALRLVDQFLPARVTGQAIFDVQLTGSPGDWRTGGTITLADCSLLAPQNRLALADWSGTLVLSPGRLETERLHGQLNGGTADIAGAVVWQDGRIVPQLTLRARDVFMELGEGFRSQIDAEIAILDAKGAPHVSGVVSLTADAYREEVAEIASAVAALTERARPRPLDLPAWLTASALDVRLAVGGPLVIQNRMAQIELMPALTLVGTVGRPALLGRIDIVPDGRIQAAGRTYRLNDSGIEFSGRSLIPTLNVSGETRVGTYEVTLRLTGPADEIETSLSSDPPLGERDLQSLLLTGQTTGVTGTTEGNSQFVVDAVSADVLGIAGRFIGLDSIQLGTDDFELVSGDVKPARRLTVSKRMGMRFELLFSENLDDDELTWIIIYRPRAGYELRVSSRENVEQSVEVRREISFGPGAPLPRAVSRTKAVRETIDDVVVRGQPGFHASEVLGALKLNAGDRFDFTEWWRDRDRIERFYVDRGFFAVRVVPTRTVISETLRRIRLEYRIIRGPRTELAIAGYEAPRVLVEQLELSWSGAVLPEFLPERLTGVARRHLTERGYLRAQIAVEISRPDAEMLRALIRVTPGPLTTERHVTFAGNEVIDTRELEALVAPLAEIDAWVDPAVLADAIESEYQGRGHAGARARAGEPTFAGTTATLPVVISEGAPTRVRTLRLDGVAAARDDETRSVIGLAEGAPVTPSAVRQARIRLERHYRNQGYRDARVTASSRVEADTGLADLTVSVVEGPLYTLREVRIEGVQTTRESLVRSAVTIAPGTVASPAAIAETERRLYGLGVFRAAAVRLEPVVPPPSEVSTAPVDALVAVEESRRYQLRFGFETTTEYEPAISDRTNGAGLAVDLRDRNFLGRAMSLGVGVRYEPSLQSFRTLFAVPRLRSWPLRTNVHGIWRREEDDAPSGLTYRDDTTELIVEQRWQPRRAFELAWGYSLNWRDVRLLTPQQSPRRGFEGVLASVYGTVTIDRRDSALDATRGWFQSASAQWGLRALGSSVGYLRLHLRSTYYLPVGPLVLASAVRVGSIVSWDGRPGPNVEDLFFKAGGTQSVRGYAQDALSAIEFQGIPFGGTRVLVLNQEVRFPMVWRLAGVVFTDAGNTFLSEGIELSDLRLGAGFGLRIRTPLAPIRLDLGWPLSTSDGRGSARWHFSIGQMF